jgi:hypothetical protein
LESVVGLALQRSALGFHAAWAQRTQLLLLGWVIDSLLEVEVLQDIGGFDLFAEGGSAGRVGNHCVIINGNPYNQ